MSVFDIFIYFFFLRVQVVKSNKTLYLFTILIIKNATFESLNFDVDLTVKQKIIRNFFYEYHKFYLLTILHEF
jgi:hypothetical protein